MKYYFFKFTLIAASLSFVESIADLIRLELADLIPLFQYGSRSALVFLSSSRCNLYEQNI